MTFAKKMHFNIRIATRDPVLDKHPDLTEKIRSFVLEAPGINSVTSIEPHNRGGYSVVGDRAENLDGIDEYFEASDYMFVL